MKKKILVIDDSPFMLTLINDMLIKLNYKVTTIDNGREACQILDSNRYDLIITDMNMPFMDGLEFTKQVRSRPSCRFVPIVMLSSEEDDEKISKAKKLGISTFISKPPKEGQLKNILQIILNKRGAPRMSVQLEVFYGEEEKLLGHTSNLSLLGLFIETSNISSPGEKMKLKFLLPGEDQPIKCMGRVSWIASAETSGQNGSPRGMGIEFVDLKDEHKIKEFLKSVSWGV